MHLPKHMGSEEDSLHIEHFSTLETLHAFVASSHCAHYHCVCAKSCVFPSLASGLRAMLRLERKAQWHTLVQAKQYVAHEDNADIPPRVCRCFSGVMVIS